MDSVRYLIRIGKQGALIGILFYFILFSLYRHQLWELRPMPERVFYGVWKKNNFVLLNHYTKKKNETDPPQIERALVRKEG